jgi:hypothetical protein
MAAHDSPRQSADTSTAWQLMHLSWRLGFMQAKNDLNHARTQSMVKEVLAMQQRTEPAGPLKTLATKWRSWAADFVLLHKLLVAVRIVSLPTLAYTLWTWLGWFVKLLIGR